MKKAVALALVAIIVIAGASVWWLGYIPKTERAMIRRAQVLAASGLIDPSSAQFRRLTTGTLKGGELKGRRVLCGEINGKNGNGAYAGFTRFVASNDPKLGSFMEPSSMYSQSDEDESDAKCTDASKLRSQDLSDLYQGRSDCEHAIEVHKDRESVHAFEDVWANSQCVLPAL